MAQSTLDVSPRRRAGGAPEASELARAGELKAGQQRLKEATGCGSVSEVRLRNDPDLMRGEGEKPWRFGFRRALACCHCGIGAQKWIQQCELNLHCNPGITPPGSV